ncbi:MAG: hypothetical protein H2172_13385 [Opitutus sp.]|nr:hypothetical protein [Opitutus sp.]MCS6248406.1 hypothetical protein [Opitutus sp.]MCS6275223.1 hypothetical protein [Opitutus sp.]MCS6275748.1 hypothetical protein [Opitutus sp.]MCS6300844.1 hypothetical protein [Opitutus sp.]
MTPALLPEPTGTANSALPSTPTSAPRADFDQHLANELTVTASLISAALNRPEVMAELSYSITEIEEGRALHVAAQQAFNARQQAVSTSSTANKNRDQLLTSVREDFSAYRATVQANFPEEVRTALGAGGRVPADLQKFITLVRSAYATAQQAPYAAVLAKRKLTQAVLTSYIAQVDELVVLDGKAKAADQGAIAATQMRDEAGTDLRKWIGSFRKQAKADLRKFPELRAQLDL